MSRYVECDEWDESSILASGRWERNAPRVFKSKRGQAALRQLREAIVALPDKRLISGALSTLGASEEIERDKEDVASGKRGWRHTGDLEDVIKENGGEGVCAIGALLLHHHVQEGKTPTEAAAALPRLAFEDIDALWETAQAAKVTGMVQTLAWQVAYHNDEVLDAITPEDRYQRMLAWIDSKLGTVPA